MFSSIAAFRMKTRISIDHQIADAIPKVLSTARIVIISQKEVPIGHSEDNQM